MKLTNFSDNSIISKFFESRGQANDRSQKGNHSQSSLKFTSIAKSSSFPKHVLEEKLREEAIQLASNVKVKGTGLSQGLVATSNTFKLKVENINMKYLTVDVGGPSSVKLTTLSTPTRDNKYAEFEYRVNRPGEYVFCVEYRDQPIPGSPFQVKVSDNLKFLRNSAQVVKASGKGLKQTRAGEMSTFRVNLSRTGNRFGRLNVYVDNESGEPSCEVGYLYWGGGCTVFYSCPSEGKYKLTVKYNGNQIPGSPFPLECSPSPEPWLVTAMKWITTKDN